jgi:dienelactone hydrolase
MSLARFSHCIAVVPLLLVSLAASAQTPAPLPGTTAWQVPADPAEEMVEGIHRHLDKMLAGSLQQRDAAWARNNTYGERLGQITRMIGAVAPPAKQAVMERVGGLVSLATSPKVRVDRVRWTVFDDTWLEGLVVEPLQADAVRCSGVMMGDADEAPEILAGLAHPENPRFALAVRMAESGARVLIPTLLSRDDRFSGDAKVRFTNLSHREWIWRMGWETGRTPIGFEVDAVVHGLHLLNDAQKQGQPGGTKPLFVYGHGEGGRVALITAAVDPRVKAAWVSGYFQSRDTTGWLEPIDRTLWRQALSFQDAEFAALAAQKPGDGILMIDRTAGPTVAGPKPPRNGRDDAADGSLKPADHNDIEKELNRARTLAGAGAGRILDAASQAEALEKFQAKLQLPKSAAPEPLKPNTNLPDAQRRMKETLDAWAAHTQHLLRTSELKRFDYWKAANPQKPADWAQATGPLRKAFWQEQIGEMPAPTEPLAAQSKLVYDEPNFKGYAVKLPVYADVYAYGVLLLPKDLKPGEKRPVVVCQHGLEGRPDDIVDPAKKNVYHAYGAALADRGYIVFAPQNPYIGQERFRTIQRKAWPLGQSLFAVIFRQHERILDWLQMQDFVDPARIAFYGLSYGGKSAMRIPAALPRYCLSICSADFNEWVVKCTNTDRQYSYMFTIEYDMYEWDLASRFNYAEMAALIAPRPFLIERGHFDGVAPDEWIGYEFAKVKRTFDLLGAGDKTGIAYFNRNHEIDGTETFAFLAKHLNWPRGAKPLVVPK